MERVFTTGYRIGQLGEYAQLRAYYYPPVWGNLIRSEGFNAVLIRLVAWIRSSLFVRIQWKQHHIYS
jgi:hypothetical protein